MPDKDIESVFRLLWADNGDAMSMLYAGTRALKRDVTRTGMRTSQGAFDDGYNSAMRYYINNYRDARTQRGLDLTLGVLQEKECDISAADGDRGYITSTDTTDGNSNSNSLLGQAQAQINKINKGHATAPAATATLVNLSGTGSTSVSTSASRRFLPFPPEDAWGLIDMIDVRGGKNKSKNKGKKENKSKKGKGKGDKRDKRDKMGTVKPRVLSQPQAAPSAKEKTKAIAEFLDSTSTTNPLPYNARKAKLAARLDHMVAKLSAPPSEADGLPSVFSSSVPNPNPVNPAAVSVNLTMPMPTVFNHPNGTITGTSPVGSSTNSINNTNSINGTGVSAATLSSFDSHLQAALHSLQTDLRTGLARPKGGLHPQKNPTEKEGMSIPITEPKKENTKGLKDLIDLKDLKEGSQPSSVTLSSKPTKTKKAKKTKKTKKTSKKLTNSRERDSRAKSSVGSKKSKKKGLSVKPSGSSIRRPTATAAAVSGIPIYVHPSADTSAISASAKSTTKTRTREKSISAAQARFENNMQQKLQRRGRRVKMALVLVTLLLAAMLAMLSFTQASFTLIRGTRGLTQGQGQSIGIGIDISLSSLSNAASVAVSGIYSGIYRAYSTIEGRIEAFLSSLSSLSALLSSSGSSSGSGSSDKSGSGGGSTPPNPKPNPAPPSPKIKIKFKVPTLEIPSATGAGSAGPVAGKTHSQGFHGFTKQEEVKKGGVGLKIKKARAQSRPSRSSQTEGRTESGQEIRGAEAEIVRKKLPKLPQMKEKKFPMMEKNNPLLKLKEVKNLPIIKEKKRLNMRKENYPPMGKIRRRQE